MELIFIISCFLLLADKSYSQRTANTTFDLFPKIDWSIWQNMDIVNCTTNRLGYTKYFDSLFVTGISRDSVEKFLGKGIDISTDNIWHRKVKSKKIQEEIFYYDLTWNCRFHGGERRLILFYQKGKLKKCSSKQIIIYD